MNYTIWKLYFSKAFLRHRDSWSPLNFKFHTQEHRRSQSKSSPAKLLELRETNVSLVLSGLQGLRRRGWLRKSWQKSLSETMTQILFQSINSLPSQPNQHLQLNSFLPDSPETWQLSVCTHTNCSCWRRPKKSPRKTSSLLIAGAQPPRLHSTEET